VPVYFFHLRDGIDILRDPDGRDLADVAAAAAHALTEARALIGADALGGRINLRPCIDVEDGAGEIVHRLSFADAIDIVRPL
jgi:hypothetical protein